MRKLHEPICLFGEGPAERRERLKSLVSRLTDDEIARKLKKREEQETHDPIYGRPVMGRKGIGKLSFFGITDYAEITTIQNKQKLDNTEEIEIIYVSIQELDQKIKKGEIKAADTIAALNLVRINYPEFFKP